MNYIAPLGTISFEAFTSIVNRDLLSEFNITEGMAHPKMIKSIVAALACIFLSNHKKISISFSTFSLEAYKTSFERNWSRKGIYG